MTIAMLTSLFLLCCSCGTGHGLGSQVPLLVGLAQEIMQVRALLERSRYSDPSSETNL